MTFAALLSDVYDRLNYAASPATAVVTRAKRLINEAHQELLSTPGLQSLLYTTTTLASVAATAEYAFPAALSRVISIRDRANQWKLREYSRDWYREMVPTPSAFSATPHGYVLLGPQAVQKHVVTASASGFSVVSTAAETPTIYVEGVNSAGQVVTTSVAMTGVTPVVFATAQLFARLTDVYLSAAAVGTITLTAVVDSTLLVTLSPGQTRGRFEWIALVGTPSAVLTYDLEYEREITQLVNDTDEPLLPPRFHRLLAKSARVKEYEKTDDTRYSVAKAEYDHDVRLLIYFVTRSPESMTIPGGLRDRSSNLGPMYPAGRW